MSTTPILKSNIYQISSVNSSYAANPVESVNNPAFNYEGAVGDSVSFSGANSNTAANETATTLKSALNETKEKQGWCGKLWDGFKNLTGIGAGSDKAAATIEKFEKGEISEEEALKSVEGYIKGQKQGVDTIASFASAIASGLALTVSTAAGIAAAPFTAGASLGLVATGIGIAAGAGAVVNTVIKGTDAASGGREYTFKDGLKDAGMGALNGSLAVFTAGAGNAVTQATRSVITNATKNVVLSTGKQAAIRVGTAAIGGSTGGAIFGGVSGGANYLAEGGSLDEGFVDAVKMGTAGGAIFGAIAGGVAEGAVVAKEAVTKTGMFDNGSRATIINNDTGKPVTAKMTKSMENGFEKYTMKVNGKDVGHMYGRIVDDHGVSYYEICKLKNESGATYGKVGTSLVKKAVLESHAQGAEGRVCLFASAREISAYGDLSPTPFYWKLGFRFDDFDQDVAFKQWLNDGAIQSDLPGNVWVGRMYLTENTDKIFGIPTNPTP